LTVRQKESLAQRMKQWLPSPPTSMHTLPVGQSFDVWQRLLHTEFVPEPGS
jgi:hypothetical protein